MKRYKLNQHAYGTRCFKKKLPKRWQIIMDNANIKITYDVHVNEHKQHLILILIQY